MLAVIGLAQAAAVLVGIWLLNPPTKVENRDRLVEVARVEPASFDIEHDETLVISIDGDVIKNRRVSGDEPQALALNDLPANDNYLALSSMESLSHE